jgi:choline-sulfatase
MMDRRIGMLTLGAVAAAGAAWMGLVGIGDDDAITRGESPATNIVWILVDTLRYDHLQTYGYDTNPTSPNIDAFAERATVFDNAFSSAPWTKPSVASMMTARLPRELGIYDWDHILDPKYVTFAEHLQANGFHTEAHFSHIAFDEKETNFGQGFDVYDGSATVRKNVHKIKSSAAITDAAVQFLQTEEHERFFLWLHYFDPHRDYLKHEEFSFGKKRRALYDGEIAFTDKHLGRLFKVLKETGRLADTAIVFVADHGEGLGQHGIAHHTSALYEHQTHVPLIVYAPWMSPARRGEIVSAVSIAPTLLKMLNVSIPKGFTGLPIPMTDEGFNPEPNGVAYAETRRFTDQRSVMNDGWKLIHNVEKDTFELYNFVDDPEESKDWSAHDAARLASMKLLLAGYTEAPQTEPKLKPLNEDMKAGLKSLGYIQ